MKFRLLERVLFEDIESMKKYFPNVPDEQFQSLIELDPTYTPGSKNAGTYGRWILTLANKGKLDNIGHVKDLLTRFNDNAKYLKNKDIMRYKTMDEVEDMLNDDDSYKEQSHRQEVRDRQKARKNADLGNEAKKVYEDSKWEVWVPLTYAASCKLGQGSSWCTASTESDYYYNHYKNAYGGNYYININKNDPDEKYQFHFESNQFMDADDDAIDLSKFLSQNPGLKKFYTDVIFESFVLRWGLDVSNTVDVDTEVLSNILSEGSEIDSTFLQACFNNDVFEYFLDVGSYTTMDGVKNAVMYYTNKENSKTLIDITGYDPDDGDFLANIMEEFPEVYDALSTATSEGEEVGAEVECMNDFEEELRSSMGRLISQYQLDYGKMTVAVNMEYLKDNIFDLLSEDDEDDEDFSHALGNYMYSDFNFYEPRYGWSGFNEDAYNDRLSDELAGLE